jgi:hypothetical protein
MPHGAKAVLTDLLEPQAYGGNPPHWDEAMAALPEGPLRFLDAAAVPARRAAADLPADRDAALRKSASAAAADPALRAFAWYLHWRVFVAPQHGPPWGPPPLVQRLGDLAGSFYELLALEFVPRLHAWHRALGYPPAVTRETVQQIASYEGNHLRGVGRPGMYGGQFAWLATYLVQPYVRLGRFEYQLHPYGGGAVVWKRAADGQVLALAENGARVADDGLRLPADAPAGAGWTAAIEESADAITGFPIAPTGHVLRSPVRLDPAAWTRLLQPGVTVLDLHIPAGGAMTWEAMTESFRRALEFFARHHANQPFAALVVSTWFMDPRLADLLPPDANPLRLQRAVYLYPTPPGPGGLWFVFLRDTAAADPATLPRATSLQRALGAFLDTGRTWNGGGMFLLPDDMAHLSEGHYRKRFAELRGELGLQS